MTKQANYTEAQTAELIRAYEAANDAAARDQVIQQYAELFGRTVNSIQGKLVQAKVYVKKEATASKTAESAQDKAAMVKAIAIMTGIDYDEIASLEKGNKKALKALIEFFKLHN